MAWTFLLGFVAMTLVFVWMVAVRYRIEVLRDRSGDEELEVSLAERWAEGAGVPATPARGEPAGLSGARAQPGVPGELRRRRLRRRLRRPVVLRARPGAAPPAARARRPAGRRPAPRPRNPGDGDRPGRPPTGAAGRRAPLGPRPGVPTARPGAAGSGYGVVVRRAGGPRSSSSSSRGSAARSTTSRRSTRPLAHRASLGTSTIRLEGVVVRGSISSDVDRGPTSPSPEASRRLAVENTGSPPQLFQPDIPVVVVGHFASGGSDVFVSDQIMVKHSAQYIGAAPGPGARARTARSAEAWAPPRTTTARARPGTEVAR